MVTPVINLGRTHCRLYVRMGILIYRKRVFIWKQGIGYTDWAQTWFAVEWLFSILDHTLHLTNNNIRFTTQIYPWIFNISTIFSCLGAVAIKSWQFERFEIEPIWNNYYVQARFLMIIYRYSIHLYNCINVNISWVIYIFFVFNIDRNDINYKHTYLSYIALNRY